MRLLLDSHVALWALASPARLGPTTRHHLLHAELTAFSPVTPWELGIKAALGKLVLPDDMADQLERDGFTELPIRSAHAALAAGLPSLHRDPFARMLVAQAIRERLTLVSADTTLSRYDVETLDAHS